MPFKNNRPLKSTLQNITILLKASHKIYCPLKSALQNITVLSKVPYKI